LKGILKSRDTFVVFILSGERCCKKFIDRGAIGANTLYGLGYFLCADPLPARQPNLRQRRQDLDVFWPAAGQIGCNIFGMRDVIPALQERDVVEADGWVKI